MRLIERRDAPLVVGLIAGTAVMFGQPLRFALHVAEDVSSTYHVDLIPGFVIFVVVSTVHYWRKHRDAVTAIQLNAREAEEAKRTAADLEQLVVASHAIANAVDAESLRVETWRQIPAVLKHRRCWLAVTTRERWRWLIEPSGDSEVTLEGAASLLQLAESGECRHNEWLIVPLHSSGRALGILLIDVTSPMSDPEKSRVETLATVVAIALKNVQLFEEMQATGSCDALTGCLNRGHAFQTLDREMRRSKRSRAPLSVVMFDLDGFKEVNDRHGHLTGDRVLEAIGDILQSTLRTTDFKCRYGGDEFLVILPDTRFDSAVHVADHLRRALESVAIQVANASVTCKVSIGVAVAGVGELDAVALVQRADEALYRDKIARLASRDMQSLNPDQPIATGGSPQVTVSRVPGSASAMTRHSTDEPSLPLPFPGSDALPPGQERCSS